MAQLSDDCFAFGGTLLTIDAVRRIIADSIPCVERTELADLGAADGRVLAEDLVAPVDLPPFDNAAVDGYAVHFADLADTAVLPVDGRLAAGAAVVAALAPMSARRIFTGAAMPPRADTIFMQEDVRLDEQGRVVLPAGLKRGANTRPRGEDIAVGIVALRRGRRLRPQDIALAAALGMRQLPVRRPIRVALFSTGDELVEPGDPGGASQRFDSNRVLLAALVRRTGARVLDLGILPDRHDAIAAALRSAAADCDLILTSGGVSAGEEDHVKAAVEAAGRLVFWRLAMKPGRPVAMGIVAGTPFIGLPGNPVSSFVTFLLLVRPFVLRLQGQSDVGLVRSSARADFAWPRADKRREFLRVRRNARGVLDLFPNQSSGVLTSTVWGDGLVDNPAGGTISPGDTVQFISFAECLA